MSVQTNMPHPSPEVMKTRREIKRGQEQLLHSSPTQRSVASFAVQVFLWWRPSLLLCTLLWHLKAMLLSLLPSPLWVVPIGCLSQLQPVSVKAALVFSRLTGGTSHRRLTCYCRSIEAKSAWEMSIQAPVSSAQRSRKTISHPARARG